MEFLSKETEVEEEVDLIPSEHPEKITSLQELEAKIGQLNELLKKENLKDEDKKKIELLKNLYLQQKNILMKIRQKKLKNK